MQAENNPAQFGHKLASAEHTRPRAVDFDHKLAELEAHSVQEAVRIQIDFHSQHQAELGEELVPHTQSAAPIGHSQYQAEPREELVEHIQSEVLIGHNCPTAHSLAAARKQVRDRWGWRRSLGRCKWVESGCSCRCCYLPEQRIQRQPAVAEAVVADYSNHMRLLARIAGLLD